MSASTGMPFLKPNDSSVTRSSSSRPAVRVADPGAELVHVQRRGVDDQVGRGPQRGQQVALAVDAVQQPAVALQRVRAPDRLLATHDDLVATASRNKISGMRPGRLELGEHRRQLLEERAGPDVEHHGQLAGSRSAAPRRRPRAARSAAGCPPRTSRGPRGCRRRSTGRRRTCRSPRPAAAGLHGDAEASTSATRRLGRGGRGSGGRRGAGLSLSKVVDGRRGGGRRLGAHAAIIRSRPQPRSRTTRAPHLAAQAGRTAGRARRRRSLAVPGIPVSGRARPRRTRAAPSVTAGIAAARVTASRKQQRQRPAAADVVQHPDQQRAERAERVRDALGEAAQGDRAAVCPGARR